MEIRVAIFEDNDLLRKNLAALVNSAADMVCTGAFAHANKLVQNLAAATPDIVLMDINMPGVSGIEAVQLIKTHQPSVGIIMQTVFEDNDKIFAAVCAGASGYLLKKTLPQKLLEAIRETFTGGAPMAPGIAAKVLEMVRLRSAGIKKEFITLSEREKEILRLLVAGKQYKTIAAECFISIDTVGTHVRHIYEKLQVHSKSEAVAKAINQKLV